MLKNVKENDFIYLDPPYIPLTKSSSFTVYNSNGFTLENQKELVEIIKQLNDKKAKIMISNSDTELTRKLYKEFNIHSVLASRNINSDGQKRNKINELIITNY